MAERADIADAITRGSRAINAPYEVKAQLDVIVRVAQTSMPEIDHVALAMGRVRAEENLSAALASRTTIGVALGLVMERYGMGQDEAFAYLTRIASSSETKLRAVAEHLIAEAAARNQRN